MVSKKTKSEKEICIPEYYLKFEEIPQASWRFLLKDICYPIEMEMVYPITVEAGNRKINEVKLVIIDDGFSPSISSSLYEQLFGEIPREFIESKYIIYTPPIKLSIKTMSPNTEFVTWITFNSIKYSNQFFVRIPFGVLSAFGADVVLTEINGRHYVEFLYPKAWAYNTPPTIVKHRGILILGKYSKEGFKRMKLIESCVNTWGYEGIILSEYGDFLGETLEEKVNLLGALSRFIICENSFKSGHIDELKICAMNKFITCILHEKGKFATKMQEDYDKLYPFIKLFEYSMKNRNENYLPYVLKKAVSWARTHRIRRYFDLYKKYPWIKKQNRIAESIWPSSYVDEQGFVKYKKPPPDV